jgi:hypothetical protein
MNLFGSVPALHDNDLSSFFSAEIITAPPVPRVPTEEAASGELVFTQTFYEGPPTCTCCKNWVEKEPNDIPKDVKQKYVGAAIVVYKSKDHDSNTIGSLKKFKAQSVAIQSPVIRKEIKPIIEKYGSFVEEKQVFSISSPFNNLFFSHSQILRLYESYEEDSEEKTNLKLLVDVMKDLFRDLSPMVTNLHSRGAIDETHLWTLFPKGILAYKNMWGQDRAYEVLSFRKNGPDWVLLLRFVTFNGTTFVLETTPVKIRGFKGTRDIDSLEIYPLSFHANPRLLEENLERRGREALKYQGISFQYYAGSSELIGGPSRLDEESSSSDHEYPELDDEGEGETLNSMVSMIHLDPQIRFRQDRA